MNMDILDKIKLVIETEEDNKAALIRAKSKEKFNGEKARKAAAMKSLGLKSLGWDNYENKSGEKFSWDGSKFVKHKPKNKVDSEGVMKDTPQRGNKRQLGNSKYWVDPYDDVYKLVDGKFKKCKEDDETAQNKLDRWGRSLS